MAAAATGGGSARGAWIPWAFVLFFVVVTAVNGVMIWYALESWTGLSSGEAYDDGLRYNHNLQAARRQAELGWQPRLVAHLTGAHPAGGNAAVVELALTDTHGQAVAGATVEAGFERPLQQAMDFTVALAPDRPGHYRAAFQLPLVGVWDAHVSIRRGDDLYVLQQRLILR